MRKFLLIGTGALFLAGAGAAFAQMPADGPGGGPGGDEDHMGPPHGPHMMEMMHHHWEHMRHDEEGAMGGGAAFRFRKGDMEIGVKCAEDEPTFVCVRATSMLLDKLNGLNGGTSGNAGASTSGNASGTAGGANATPNAITNAPPHQP